MISSRSVKKSLLTKDEAKSLLKLFYQTRVQKDLPRSGWFYKGIKMPESLADHSWHVSFIALSLAEYLQTVKKMKIDWSKVVCMSVIHDLPELKTMDIPTPIVAKYIGRDHKHEMERDALMDLFSNSILAVPVLAWWKEFDDKQTLEAKIVNCADKLDMMLQVIHYQEMGHQNMKDFWEDGKNIFRELGLEVFYDALRDLAQSIK